VLTRIVITSVLLAACCGTACGALGPDSQNLLTAPGTITSFAIQDSSGKAVWKIARASGASLERIGYGVVPAGFVQQEPAAGAPRPLVPGETIAARTETERWWCLHQGQAVGANGFRGGYWECGRPGRAPATKGFDTEATPP
jgi:hypothetical protein